MSLTTGIAHDGKLVIAPLYTPETLRSLYHQLLLTTERSLQLVYSIQIIQFLAPRVTSIQSLHPNDRSRLIVSPSEITRIRRGGVIAHGSDNHWILSQCLHVLTINIHDFYRGREITISYRIRIRFLHLSEQHHGAIGRKTYLTIDTRCTDFRFSLRSYLHQLGSEIILKLLLVVLVLEQVLIRTSWRRSTQVLLNDRRLRHIVQSRSSASTLRHSHEDEVRIIDPVQTSALCSVHLTV